MEGSKRLPNPSLLLNNEKSTLKRVMIFSTLTIFLKITPIKVLAIRKCHPHPFSIV